MLHSFYQLIVHESFSNRSMKIQLELRLFGGLEVRLDDQPIHTLVSRKAEALLVYLACNPHTHLRDALANLLWDERSQQQAMGNLRVVINSLRQRVAPALAITRQTLSISRTGNVWTDAVEFEQLLTELAERQSNAFTQPFTRAATHTTPLTDQLVVNLERALELYRGDFLAGFYVRDAQQFEEWARVERERYQILALKAAQALTVHYLQTERYAAGIAIVQRWLYWDALNEDAHRLLMNLLLYSGQRTAALEHYEGCIALFRQEGLAPPPMLEALYQQIARDEIGAQVEHVAQGFTGPETIQVALPNNLPSPLTPIIGREEELTKIEQRLTSVDCRLLTLIGVGGVGKTRLAIESAHRLILAPAVRSLFSDGIYFVRLERVTPDDLLPSVIASAINYSFQRSFDQTQQLLNYLRNRHLLLVLDNLEHLLDSVDLLLDILQHAPQVKMLVTSRERLNVLGEWLLELDGLPYPLPPQPVGTIPYRPPNPKAWHSYGAPQLFIQTAGAVQPGFLPTQHQHAIVEICQTMQGLPLGIQLAAASVRNYSCRDIATAIHRNLDFLSTTMRNLPERHRSLRAAFTHSWQLLGMVERQAFQQLSIFQNGFNSQAAMVVADVQTETLRALADKSLIQLVEDVAGEEQALRAYRYHMHPVLHQYATEQLAENPVQEQLLREQHSHYFCALVAEQVAKLQSAAAGSAALLLLSELDNIRTGWHHAVTNYQHERLRQILPGLMRFYLLRGLLQEGLTLLDGAVEQFSNRFIQAPAERRPLLSLLARLYGYRAEFFTERGRYDTAFGEAQACIAHADRSDDLEGKAIGYLQWGIALNRQGNYTLADQKLQECLAITDGAALTEITADAHRYIGRTRFYQGDYEGGQVHHEQAIALYRQLDNLPDELRTYNSLAMFYLFAGDYLNARAHYNHCLENYRRMGERPAIGLALNNLGAVCAHLGDYAAAQSCFEEALAIKRRIGDRQMEGLLICNLGFLWHRMNLNAKAAEYCQQALEIAIELGDRDTEAYARTCLGHALLELGRIPEAIGNYEQAVALRQQAGQLTQELESLAGLARAYQRYRELPKALTYVDIILPRLTVNAYAGIVELIRIYLTCYQILHLQEDARADSVLTLGHSILQERAGKISDPQLRQCYLENVVAHRELLTEYEISRQV